MTNKYLWQLKLGEKIAVPVFNTDNVKIVDRGVISTKLMDRLIRFGIEKVWVYPLPAYIS